MKTKRDWAAVPSKFCTSGILSLLGVAGSSTFAQAPAPGPVTPPAKQAADNIAASSQTTAEKAWAILREGLKNENADRRAKAVRALGLLSGNAEAEKPLVYRDSERRDCRQPGGQLASGFSGGGIPSTRAIRPGGGGGRATAVPPAPSRRRRR